ncbi:opsin, ultraviolet-sensitive [Neocloeon triangulifer]|uniref:opsin, ultraviolet-sensitive n=1 Tax=Neocloeon triangulifer TaxID=2078957 RepID=UPI00286FAB30|nr:opsin, ultraviolet-sensitive [Neocloeon triangulifer]
MSPRADAFSHLYENVSRQVLEPSFRSAPRMLAWNVPSHELVNIPEHWLSYPEPDPSWHYMLALIYIGLTIVALTGNGLVIWIFGTAKSLRSSSNMFVVNLAIADFMMMLKTPIFIYNSFHEGYALGYLYCQIFAAVGSMSGILQATTNLCISYDRYRTISRPLDGKLSKGKVFFMILLTWGYAIPWTLMPLTSYWGRFVPEGYLTSCTFDYLTNTMENKMFVFFIFVFSYFIPMFSIIFFYSQIVGHVVNHEKALKAQAKKMNVDSLRSGEKANASAEIRIAKTAIGICALFVASWTPYAVLALIGAFGNQALLTPTMSMLPALCCKLVACIDPYVYAISHPRYRHELQKRLPWLKINEPSAASDTSSVSTTATSENTEK